MVDNYDGEFAALKKLIDAFMGIESPEARQRLLDYLQSRFGHYPEPLLREQAHDGG